MDDERFALDGALGARGWLKLDTFTCLHPSPEATRDRHDRHLNLGIDIGRFADDETASGADSALKLSIDAQGVVKRDFSLK